MKQTPNTFPLLLLAVLPALDAAAQSPAVEHFPNYHPMIVHFPIVFLLLAAGMQWAGFFVKSRGLHVTVLVLAALGYATAYFAAAWRHPHIEPEAVSAAAKAVFEEHQKFARWSVWLGGAGAALKGLELYFKRRRLVFAVLVALVLNGSAAAVSISGHHGAEMVHKHGIGPKGDFLEKH